jgi:hypothetical protein
MAPLQTYNDQKNMLNAILWMLSSIIIKPLQTQVPHITFNYGKNMDKCQNEYASGGRYLKVNMKTYTFNH